MRQGCNGPPPASVELLASQYARLLCVSHRDDELRRAKEERAARQAQKQRQAAALAIQRAWLGAVARRALRQRLRREWLQAHGATVAQPDAMLPPQQLAGGAGAAQGQVA